MRIVVTAGLGLAGCAVRCRLDGHTLRDPFTTQVRRNERPGLGTAAAYVQGGP